MLSISTWRTSRQTGQVSALQSNPWGLRAIVADRDTKECGFLPHLLRPRGLERDATLPLSHGLECLVQRSVLLGIFLAVLADSRGG